MAKNSIIDLGPKKVARLLGITFDSDKDRQGDSKQGIEEMLEACLAGPVLPEITGLEDVRPIAGRSSGNLQKYPGVSLGDILTASDADFATIKEIRQYAKKMTGGKGPEAERVAVTIYFAAIANALLFHDAKITSYSYASLESSFNKLIKKEFMPERLRRLFVDSAEVCRNKDEKIRSR